MSRVVPNLLFAFVGVLALSAGAISCQAETVAPTATAATEHPEADAAASVSTESNEAGSTSAHPDAVHGAAADHAHGGADHPEGGAGHHDAGHHDGGEHGHGVYTIWGDLSLWALVAFIGFVFAIKKLGLWDLLQSSMSDREKAAWAKLDAADAKLNQAETSLRKFRGQFEALDDTVRSLLAEGQRDVEHMQGQVIQEAEAEAETAVGRASYEVERVKSQTLHSLFEMLADKVVSATESSLRERMQSADQDRLIEATLGEFNR